MLSRAVAGVLSSVLLLLTGYGWVQYHSFDSGLRRSDALAGGPKSVHGDVNLLIMGLDTRLDENGSPLPAEMYQALHAGDASNGGENANVLMLVHVPGDGSKATSISIPRDDYVDLPGCPDEQCKGKIKQAYGLAFDAASKQLAPQTGLSQAQRVQAERDAGRKAEIATVSQFLGGVPIDHFVEVTLAAFLQIAQVVQPITVCLNQDTQDRYSGANFHAGRQQINAAQAVAFVRQRRDNVHPELEFTDLDRARRQQAFIASLGYQLKQAGTLANPNQLHGILDVAKQNLAVDSGLDLLAFAQDAANLTAGNISFVTLPVDHFGTTPGGEAINVVDVPRIQALVHQLLTGGPPTPPSPAASAAPSAALATVDIVNANGRPGLAAGLQQTLSSRGYTAGATSTGSQRQMHTVVYYGTDPSGAATLAALLGGVATAHDPALAAGHLRIVLGADYTAPPPPVAGPPTTPAPASAASTSGADSPTPDAISGGGIPCVK